jgi:Ca2+-binding RTX toxin-like protein
LATFTVDPRRLLGNLRARIAWGDGSITDGILKSEGANNVFSVVGSHTYADPFSGTATVTLLDNGGTVATVNATVSIAENDDPVPTVVLSGDSSGIRGQTRRVRITTSDRAADLAANFIYQVDWGDGVKQTIVGSAVKDLTHVYNVAGNFTVKVKATDQNGQTGPVSQTTISILAAEVQNDPCEPGKKSLFIGGTLNGDQIRLTTDKKGRINVRFGNKSIGVFPATRRIVVFGRNGSDSIQVDKRITRMVEIYGEGGNDLIAGGGGNDIIVGGAGRDQVSAGLGRDIVIGGVDSDSMLGGDGDDILIANGSTHETNRAALCAIQKEWVRNDQTYTQRINHIRGTKGGGLNGSFRFNDDSLLGPDNTLDILTGNAGTDAFFMNTDLGVKDRASDRVNSEAVGDVD